MKAHLLSLIPVGRQVLTGSGFSAAWPQSDCTQHLFGTLPGRQATKPCRP
jgi:xanthosine utilization system XapX-like protein